MAKKARQGVPVVNRKTLSRREREELYRRWVYIGAGIVMALVVAVLALGAYQQWVVAPASPVATVNGKPIRTDTYQRLVQFRRYDMRSYRNRLQSQLGQMDCEDESQSFLCDYFQQQLQQIESQLLNLPYSTLDELIDGELIRQEAQRRGITVTPDEVQRDIQRNFGYDPNPPTPEPTLTPMPTPTTITPTTPTPQTGTPEPTLTPWPTATPMTEERFKELYSQYLANVQKATGFSEAEFRALVEVTLLRQKLQTALEAEVPTTAEQIHARHILLEKEEDAKAALERLQKGEDFAALAKELSTDESNKEQGGDLGWFPRGQMVPEFEEAAFALQPGQTSGVVATSFGYHIIRVEERQADRPLSEEALSQKKATALEDWLATQRTSEGVKRFWSLDKVPKDTQAG